LRALGVPLVLHGGSSIDPDDLRRAIALGVRKINIGSRLKQAYFNALRTAVAVVPETANPYEVIGSGLKADVLIPGRLAMQREVERLTHLFGSAGKAR
jgi:fructose/tagatose bisphosphate aldolase